MSDDFNDDGMYGDIDEINKEIEYNALTKDLDEANRKNEVLMKEITEMKEQLETIVKEKERLEQNIVAVYETAVLEIARKDKQINELTEANSRKMRA